MKKELISVPASYEFLTQLDECSVPIGIEYCGRVCYKSEDKITEESAPGFCKKMTTGGHNSTLEMRVMSFSVTVPPLVLEALKKLMPKYLIIDIIEEIEFHDGDDDGYIVEALITGSIRAFREMAMLYPYCAITNEIALNIEKKYPFFFEDIDSCFREETLISGEVQRASLADMALLSDKMPDVFLRHRHIAVKFIVNRAVTHEIVRHRPCSFLQESQRYCRYADDKFGNRVTFIEPMFFKKGSSEYRIWEETMLVTEEKYLKLLETSTPQAARTVMPNSCKTEIIVFCNLVEWNHILHMRTSPAAEPSMREVMIPLQKDFQKMFPSYNFNRRFPENFK